MVSYIVWYVVRAMVVCVVWGMARPWSGFGRGTVRAMVGSCGMVRYMVWNVVRAMVGLWYGVW